MSGCDDGGLASKSTSTPTDIARSRTLRRPTEDHSAGSRSICTEDQELEAGRSWTLRRPTEKHSAGSRSIRTEDQELEGLDAEVLGHFNRTMEIVEAHRIGIQTMSRKDIADLLEVEKQQQIMEKRQRAVDFIINNVLPQKLIAMTLPRSPMPQAGNSGFRTKDSPRLTGLGMRMPFLTIGMRHLETLSQAYSTRLDCVNSRLDCVSSTLTCVPTRRDCFQLDSTVVHSTSDSARLDSTVFNSTRLRSTRLDCVQLDSTAFNSTRL
eukprot:gene22705-29862_t